ncbi:alanine racemase [Sandarakinorhabdus sp.]|uniref:alanine racemase n=1 Tax=Sandarakinorhabdus sp. TaxID=1916663 RepID=UPI00286E7A19|nr:alanine racemase [Sandarakinorhabdus sp.]
MSPTAFPPPQARLLLDSAALIANWQDFARAVGAADCGAAIKADGYGLGAREAMARLAAAGCRTFYVAHWQEVPALLPLPAGVTLSVLHGVTADELPAALALPALPVLVTAAQVALWRQTGRPCEVMVDSGMNRLGLAPSETADVLAGMNVAVLHSHLACADNPAHPLNERQRACFAEVAARVPAGAYALANSAGIALGAAFHLDLVRPGIGLFGGGLMPNGRVSRPVARIQARIIQLRDVPAGGTVGYAAAFAATRPSRIATVALGYADGYARGLSGVGFAEVAGVRCPAAGRISMDLSAFDVTDAPALAEGDWIDIPFDPETMATLAGRTSYELLVALGQRFDRVWA